MSGVLLNFSDKKAWLDKHGTLSPYDNTTESGLIEVSWSTRVTRRYFRGRGNSRYDAVNGIFDNVKLALFLLCEE